jgi:hypothetical protein
MSRMTAGISANGRKIAQRGDGFRKWLNPSCGPALAATARAIAVRATASAVKKPRTMPGLQSAGESREY